LRISGVRHAFGSQATWMKGMFYPPAHSVSAIRREEGTGKTTRKVQYRPPGIFGQKVKISYEMRGGSHCFFSFSTRRRQLFAFDAATKSGTAARPTPTSSACLRVSKPHRTQRERAPKRRETRPTRPLFLWSVPVFSREWLVRSCNFGEDSVCALCVRREFGCGSRGN